MIRSEIQLVTQIPLILALAICVAALGSIAQGGPAYVESDGSVTFTSELQTSGSDDEMTFYGAAVIFVAYVLFAGWWPRRFFNLKSITFLVAWLLQLPLCYMEVGSFEETIVNSLNYSAAIFVALYGLAPLIIITAIIYVYKSPSNLALQRAPMAPVER